MTRTYTDEANFRLVIGVGFQKTGTSSILKFLVANGLEKPPKKELHAFRPNGILQYISRPQYLGMLRARNPEHTYGEYTPAYLMEPTSIWNLNQIAPKARLLVSIRNPIDRAFSAYVHGVGSGRISANKSFPECISEALRGSNSWWENSLINFGLYAKPIQRLFTLFPKEQVMIAHFEDWTKSSATRDFEDDLLKFSGLVRNPSSRLIRVNEKGFWIAKSMPTSESIDSATRERLQDYYSESKELLEEILESRIAWWK